VEFSEGLAVVSINNKLGFIDNTRKEIIGLKYEAVFDYSKSLGALLLKDSLKRGYLNKKGQITIPYKYQDAANFSDDLDL